jgi:putative DNA primase/helicase
VNDTTSPDPFAPLGTGERVSAGDGGHAGLADADEWEPIVPAPSEPPEATQIRHSKHGQATARWVYRDAAGASLFAVARFDFMRPDGTPGKELLPYTYGRRVWRVTRGPNAGARLDVIGWHFKRPKPPVPIYALDELEKRPEASVLIAEGEKSADAAALLFPDLVCITSSGGSNAADKSDWKPVAGRAVIIWPDHDVPGIGYARDVARLAHDAGAESVRVVAVPRDWPNSWDLADLPPDGVATAQLSLMLAGARLPDDVKLPAGFVMLPAGLHVVPAPTDSNPDPEPFFVAAAFEVVAEANDGAGNAWGVVLRWLDREGRLHEWCCPKRLVHGDGNAIAAELENAGLACGTSRAAHEHLKRFIGAVCTPRLLRSVDRSGWHHTPSGPVFLLPGGETFGPGATSVVMQRDRACVADAFRAAGTLETWQSEVARYAVGNDRLVLFISAAFYGPLLDVVSDPSGGVHVFGGSQSGKTTALRCAASVYGRADPDGQLRDWRATSNGLEGVAAETSDTVLCLDELGQADGREAYEAAYMLANGGGKSRAARDGSARQRRMWRIVVLSTGEMPLAVKIAEAGRRAMAGQEVRIVSLHGDAGASLGVFQNIHDMAGAGALAAHFREATRTHYGTAGRAYLDKLATARGTDPVGLAEALKEMRDRFVANLLPQGADGQVRSVCARFGSIAAAGELARCFGVVRWPEHEATRAAANCFNCWLAERGGAGAAEDTDAVRQIRAFIEAHGTSRFEEIGGEIAAAPDLRTTNRVGFRRRVPDGWVFMVLPEAWRNEVCRGIDPKRAAVALASRNLLIPDAGGRLDRKESLGIYGRLRVFVIRGAILGAGDE